jgi:23S rRNA pseudouridine1911/1915/1917 synthase
VTGALVVLHADARLIAVAKPAGMPSVPDASGDPSALELAREWVESRRDRAGRAFVAVVHRLDRPVSGVLVFARTSKSAARLARQFAGGEARKTYWAVCAGIPRAPGGRLEQWLAKDERANRVRALAAPRPGAKRAVTEWRVLGTERGRAWLELAPETGRAHQLRVACATLGAPILGDRKYGAGAPLSDRSIALHARRLELAHPATGSPLELVAPVPRASWWRIAER